MQTAVADSTPMRQHQMIQALIDATTPTAQETYRLDRFQIKLRTMVHLQHRVSVPRSIRTVLLLLTITNLARTTSGPIEMVDVNEVRGLNPLVEKIVFPRRTMDALTLVETIEMIEATTGIITSELLRMATLRETGGTNQLEVCQRVLAVGETNIWSLRNPTELHETCFSHRTPLGYLSIPTMDDLAKTSLILPELQSKNQLMGG